MNSRGLSRLVRSAAAGDAGGITRLLRETRGDAPSSSELRQLQQSGEFLVLDHPAGGIAAAVCVTREGDNARLHMLSVDPSLNDGADVERRLIGVAESVCKAQGCASLQLELADNSEPRIYWSLGYGGSGPTLNKQI
jgi:N-acetylglutamate synthase-like GNAT family acetyltransferase